MTDLETAIMIKNMARETVRRMSARAKNVKSFKEQMADTDIIGWKSLLASIESGKTKASDYEKGLTDADAIKILKAKIAMHKSFYR